MHSTTLTPFNTILVATQAATTLLTSLGVHGLVSDNIARTAIITVVGTFIGYSYFVKIHTPTLSINPFSIPYASIPSHQPAATIPQAYWVRQASSSAFFAALLPFLMLMRGNGDLETVNGLPPFPRTSMLVVHLNNAFWLSIFGVAAFQMKYDPVSFLNNTKKVLLHDLTPAETLKEYRQSSKTSPAVEPVGLNATSTDNAQGASKED